jgi:hypothetical protein
MKYLVTIIFLFAVLFAQAPTIEWQKSFGGSDWDRLWTVNQTIDKGYIIGGTSVSGISGDKTEDTQGSDDFWILKLDSLGNIQWQNTIGSNNTDYFMEIHQTLDGEYILAGDTYTGYTGDKRCTGKGMDDYWILKLDSLGVIQWQRCIGGNHQDHFRSVSIANDGGYFLGGFSISPISGDKTQNNNGGKDYWVVKLDELGSVQWDKTLGGNDTDELQSIYGTSDGGCIAGGFSLSGISGDKTEPRFGIFADYWVVKLDGSGNIEWQNTIGGNKSDYLSTVIQTNDGGYILGGSSYSDLTGDKTEVAINGSWDYWIVKLDPQGHMQWDNTLGGNREDRFKAICQTDDNGFLVSGYSLSEISNDKTETIVDGGIDYWIVKLDTDGLVQWDLTLGGLKNDQLYDANQTSDGGYIIGGESSSGIGAHKTDVNKGRNDIWIIKLSSDQTANTTDPGAVPTAFNLYQNYPNPFNTQTTIQYDLVKQSNVEIVIYNLLGKKVLELENTTRAAGMHHTHWNGLDESGHSVNTGIYFYQLIAGQYRETRKMVLLK